MLVDIIEMVDKKTVSLALNTDKHRASCYIMKSKIKHRQETVDVGSFVCQLLETNASCKDKID